MSSDRLTQRIFEESSSTMRDEIERPWDERTRELGGRALRVIYEAVEEHKPSHIFALFSGGHDSLTATSVAFEWACRNHTPPVTAAHINTGIGIEDTRQFVHDVCADRRWPLKEYGPHPAGEKNSYEWLVMRWGFPGPHGHGIMYRRLKERWLKQIVREHKQGYKGRIAFITGIRSQESVRRMRHQMSGYERQGAAVWIAPIHDWTKADCNHWLGVRQLPRNPVVDKIHMSGECKCGAFARSGERDEDRLWFPEFAAYIDNLEERVEAAGHHACIWGSRPPAVHKDQTSLFSRRQMLCSTCEWRNEATEGAS